MTEVKIHIILFIIYNRKYKVKLRTKFISNHNNLKLN